MSTSFKFTPAQKEVFRAIADGMIIRKSGYGYSLHDASGRWVGKASIAVKSLAGAGLLAKSDDRIFFTSRGYQVWFGGAPTSPKHIGLVAAADARFAYVQTMVQS